METTDSQQTNKARDANSQLGARKHSGRIFWGAALILFGILLVARNLGFVDLRDAVRTYWPVILILIGIQVMVKSTWRSDGK
jgi:hypothetical protein